MTQELRHRKPPKDDGDNATNSSNGKNYTKGKFLNSIRKKRLN